MNNKKYVLTDETKVINGITLHRIKYVKSFSNVEEGDLGGWIESEENLSHEGNCRVLDDAMVYGNARVCGNAWVSGDAHVYGDARVWGNAWVSGDAHVYGDARVCGDAIVCDNAHVYGDAIVHGDASVWGNAEITKTSDYMFISGLGSRNRTTTFFKTKDNNIGVVCGCFNGALNEFREKVKETHGDNKYAKEYLALADLAELRLSNKEDKENE